MKNVLFIFLLIIFLISCKNEIKSPEIPHEFTLQDVFPKQHNTDSTFVFSLDSIEYFYINDRRLKTYNKDYYLQTDNDLSVLITPYLSTLCDGPPPLYKFRNVIEIPANQDSIFQHYPFSYKLKKDTLIHFYKKQFFNRGVNSDYSDTSKSFIIMFGIDLKKEFNENLAKKKVNQITESYYYFLKSFNLDIHLDSLKNEYPLNLIVTNLIKPTFPIPPKPSTVEEIEIIEEEE